MSPTARNLDGTTILHYRVLRPIGSGGMGVVYEAEDTKLGRRVALKFLPPELADDAAALERFGREARAASALNHPHICTIYAIEEANGQPFIAMELLDGESLDRRIANRPLAWDALVDTGVQIADALDAAHRRGIVHRDIKPANIFLASDGRAKVLDFGVAKMTLHGSAHADTVGPTQAEHALTGAGVAVGTIAYMSPEQARGEELDARTDVFSLAAVLYEMSTGRRAFEGKTTAVVFNKILEGAPEPPRAINPTLPPKLEDVILRGLEKDRDLRYQSAADLRAELKRLKRDATNGTLAFVPAAAATSASVALSSGAILASEARRHKGLAAAIALLVLALTAAAAYGLHSFVRSPAAPEASADTRAMMMPTRLTTGGDVRGCASISPDGKYVVYCDFLDKLRVRQVATGATVLISHEGGATTFSPDGNLVYVSTSNAANPGGVLLVVPSLGGEPRRVLTEVTGAVGVSPDGERIAFVRIVPATRETALMIADARGGNERRLATGSLNDTGFGEFGVSWSHDGKLLAATQATIVGGFRMRPVVVNAGTGKVEMLGARTWAMLGRTVWLPDNSGVLFTAAEHLEGAHQFFIARYPDGTVTQITNDARGFGNHSVGVTADGSTAVTVATDMVANIFATNADATAPLEAWTSGVRVDGGSGMEPTLGGRLFYSSADGAEITIWSVDAPGRTPRQLTKQYAEVPAAPDDGRFLAFQAIHEGRYRIWRADPDGANARVLTRGEDDIMPIVSPDGRWIYYFAAGSKGVIMRMSADGSESSVVSNLPVSPVAVSPDGRELLMSALDPSLGVANVILDAATGAIKARVGLPRDTRATWGRVDGVIAYNVDDDGVSNLWEQPIAGGPPRQLTKFTSGRIFGFDYSPDRKRLFLSRGQRTGDVVVLRNFRK